MLSISANVSWPQVFSYLGILYLLGSHRWLKGSPSVPFPCFSHLFATHIMLVGWKSCSTDLNQVFAMQHNTLTPTIRWKFKNRSIVIFLVVLLNLDKKFRCLVIISCSQDFIPPYNYMFWPVKGALYCILKILVQWWCEVPSTEQLKEQPECLSYIVPRWLHWEAWILLTSIKDLIMLLSFIVLIFIVKCPFLILFHGGLNVIILIRSFHIHWNLHFCYCLQ